VKFLCDNCKAKYQIADEKVAGKTVRMKCRKCGHQIEVRAAVTETSVSTAPPTAPMSPAPRPAARAGLATSLSAQKPRAPTPMPGSTRGDAAPTSAGGSALAGAFQRTVQDGGPQTSPFGSGQSAHDISVTDEWYVAINGVPVGPVRISELRRKAAGGAVTEDSLCWQEGLEEWRPVRAVPELAAIVREAMQGNRPSLIAPPPDPQRQSTPPRPPPPARPPAPSSSHPPNVTPAPRPPAPPNRSNVVPLRVAASQGDNDGHTQPLVAGGAAAAYAPQFAAQALPQPLPTPAPMPTAIADPFAIPRPPAAPMQASLAPPATYAPSMVPAPRRAGVPLWFWLVALSPIGFGGVAAYAVFFRTPQPQSVVIQVPATPTAPTATEAKVDAPPPTSAEPTTTASAPTAKVAMGGPAKGPSTTPATPTTPDKKTADLSGLLGGAGGPGVGGSSPGAGAGGGLDQSSVERVVASHRAGVKRTCWERGGADQKSSVNVTVSATVGPGGNVVGTSSNGDDPVVAKCIESQVKGWMFSAPGSTTTVNIPFKFVRQ